jgi:hypothetical protein
MVVDTVDEAIELANQSTYSLTSAVWTTNVHTAMYAAERLRSGYCNVNGGTLHLEPRQVFTGLGYVDPLLIMGILLTLPFSGSSGYGGFDFEDWTVKRVVVLHPPKSAEYLFSS